jgi:hypothetical protein
MVDLRRPLAVLASRMPCLHIEAALAPAFAHKDRKGRAVKDAGMFGPALSVAGAGVSAAGFNIRWLVRAILAQAARAAKALFLVLAWIAAFSLHSCRCCAVVFRRVSGAS